MGNVNRTVKISVFFIATITSTTEPTCYVLVSFLNLLSCKEYRNINALFAVLMGLSNIAVSRLALTWDKLPSKSKKTFTELEALIDPSKNHRAYRQAVGKLQSPVIPFMPLLLKGN